MFVYFLVVLLCTSSSLGSPISGGLQEPVDDNTIDGTTKATVPDEESGKAVETWEESSGVNPEELGNYFEGKIIRTINRSM